MILTFISIICYFYVLEEVSGTSTVLKLFASILIITPFTGLTSAIYLQLFPHRIIFMGYILAFIVWRDKHGNCARYAWIGYVLMVLSVVWNFEIGLGCVLAYWGSDIVKLLQQYSLKDLEGWKKIAWDIIQVPVMIICAWFFVGCYNLVVDYSWVDISVFLFPFIGNPYMSILNISLTPFISPWMLVLFVILISVIAVILSTNLCGKYVENRKISVLAACTIGVAVQMLYFINRSAYGNLYIVLPVLSLIMAYWVERLKNVEIWNSDKLCNGCFRAVCIQLVSVMILIVLMTVCRYFPIQSAKNGSNKMEGIEQLMTTVSEQIPKDTFGIGIGIPELYSYLGWDTGYYGIDMADFGVLPEESRTVVIEMVTKEENIFSNKWCLSALFLDDMNAEFYKTHDLVAEFTYGDTEFVYYTKNEFFDAIDN